MDAAHLGRMDALFHNETAGAVVSGLPLLSIPAKKAAMILEGAFSRHLRAGGAFYQFTYGPCFPLPPRVLEHLGLQASRVGFVLANMPPAAVYCIRRRGVAFASN
jgi:phosphatidylethanolamine/phosphatidyl-N-methylethanolamine N-methyltransferase